MADEKRSFATNAASSNRTVQDGAVEDQSPDVDAIEADEDAVTGPRRAEVDQFQGAKTRRATKDIISRRG